MRFTILLFFLSNIIKINLRARRAVRELIRYQNVKYVIKTRDGRRGLRFIFSEGAMRTDRVLDEFDAALVWGDAKTAFRVLTSGDPVGMQRAMANWELMVEGNRRLINWFSVFLGIATGTIKR